MKTAIRKVRIDRDVYNRARVCADDIGVPLSDWVGRAVKRHRSDNPFRVADCPQRISATRSSVVATLPELEGDENFIREAIYAAVCYCEKTRPPSFVTKLIAGHDYYIENQED